MTDPRPDLSDTRLNGDLAAWFDGEVRQAALDLRRAPLRPARARRGSTRSIAAPAAGAILVTILVVAGITRLPSLAPAAEPTGTVKPTTESMVPTSTATTPPATTSPAPHSTIVRRFGDGIPEYIDGKQVFRPSTVDHFPADYDRPFLLGGWSFDFLSYVYACSVVVGSPPPFGPVCGNQFLAETPVAFSEAPRTLLDGWTPDIPAGPVVLRVHVNDPLASSCAPAMRDACAAMAVIEEVVWTGDDVTGTTPLVPTDIFAALLGVDPGLSSAVLTPVGQAPRSITIPTSVPPSGVTWSGLPGCDTPIPMMTWSVSGSNVSYVAVFPSTGQREAAEPPLRATGFLCFVVLDALYAREWIAVDNVLVAVNVDHDGPTPAQATLVEAVREALGRR